MRRVPECYVSRDIVVVARTACNAGAAAVPATTGGRGTMRLGVDITPLQVRSPGGIGVATYETLRALAAHGGIDIVMYGRSAPVVPFSDRPADLGLPLRTGSGPLSRGGNIAWLRFGVGSMLAADGIDVFWGTRHVLPRRVRGVRLVATLHDFWYAHHPEQQPFINRALNRAVIRAAMRDGDAFTADSDATANEARALFPGAADRIRTVHLGVDATEFQPADPAAVAGARAELGVDGPFVLALDVHNPRKNFAAVLDAMAAPGGAFPPLRVVATGTPRSTAMGADIAARVERLGLTSRVVFVGDVPLERLRALYTACAAFVYPSTYEGFGMPILEAMACGAPVVCANVFSLPEVAGDAALSFDPASVSDLAGAVARVVNDVAVAERLRELGRRRVAEFSWERTAEGMRRTFEDVLAAGRRRGGRG